MASPMSVSDDRGNGLTKMTIRRFTVLDAGDIGGSPLSVAAVIADYLGVGRGDLLRVEKEPAV